MAYQNVSTPRFYINIPEWLGSMGIISEHQSYLRTLPVEPQLVSPDIFENGYLLLPPLQGMEGTSIIKGFIALLGHNYGDLTAGHNYFRLYDNEENIISQQGLYNCEIDSDNVVVPNSGFSFSKFFGSNDISKIFFENTISSEPLYIGSVVLGRAYDMPVVPDLSLSLEHDYSGIKKTTSMSGTSFSNADWIKPPKWGNKEAWQLGDFPRLYSGRRIWDLSFSYISDSDLEPRNYTGTTLDDSDVPVPSDDNWFDNILHYTMGGHLPFIFQPDKDVVYNWTDEEPSHITEMPELAICRFDMNSFSREQVAPGVYNIKIKVKESW